MELRRAIWPLREVLNTLTREGTPYVQPETRVFLRDCSDHVSQLLDMIEIDREVTSTLLDLHLSSLSARMNEIMKVLTIIATIFIPLGFLRRPLRHELRPGGIALQHAGAALALRLLLFAGGDGRDGARHARLLLGQGLDRRALATAWPYPRAETERRCSGAQRRQRAAARSSASRASTQRGAVPASAGASSSFQNGALRLQPVDQEGAGLERRARGAARRSRPGRSARPAACGRSGARSGSPATASAPGPRPRSRRASSRSCRGSARASWRGSPARRRGRAPGRRSSRPRRCRCGRR